LEIAAKVVLKPLEKSLSGPLTRRTMRIKGLMKMMMYLSVVKN